MKIITKHLCLILGLLGCSAMAWCVSGWGISAPGSLDTQNPTLSLIAPNGGEIYTAGSTQDILWYAGDSNLQADAVQIWYSADGGQNFAPLIQGWANTLSYVWDVPLETSTSAFVRIGVTDAFGNEAWDQSNSPFIIQGGLPAPEGVTLARVNAWDILISWLPVTQYLDGTSVTPTGYRILACDSPYGVFVEMGSTSGTSYLHEQSLEGHPQLFYMVVAYLEDRP